MDNKGIGTLVVLGAVGIGLYFILKKPGAGPNYDVNGDGIIDMGDVIALENMVAGNTELDMRFDWDSNGVIDGREIQILENYILTH